ncbi:MAG: two-component regulator propeller domain-containing protein, partial [Pricia sp.]
MFRISLDEPIKSLVFLITMGTVFWSYPQHPINQKSVNEGLSHSDVMVVMQDKSGFVWMGTNNGLNRFDGYDFSIYKSDLNDKNSLPNNRIRSLLTDSQNRIWIATESNQLSFYNPTSDDFSIVPIDDGSYSGHGTNLIQDGLGKIWYSTNKADLFTIEEGDGTYKTSKIILPFEGEILDVLYFKSHVWVNTRSKGIWRVDCSSKKAKRFDKPIFRETYSLTKHEDQIYVSTPEGIFSIDEELEIRNLYEGSLQEVSQLAIDYKSNIWVGLHNNGMLLLQKTLSGNYVIKTEYTSANYLSTNRVNDLLIDSFDILWIGTSGGGTHYIDLRAKPFQIIDRENSKLSDNYITAITGEGENLWIGTRSGLAYYNEQDKTSEIITGGHISSLYLDENGFLWVGKRFDGLWLYKNGKLIRSYKEKDDGLPSNEVIGVGADHLDRLWVITFDNGGVILDDEGKALTYLNESNVLPTNNLSYLYFDDKLPNTCWISSIDKGLSKLVYNDSTISSVTNYRFNVNDSTSLGSDYVWPVLRSSSGNLWVGTLGGGLNKMIEDTDEPLFRRYTTTEGLPDNDIESLLEDGTGHLWIGGRGLTRLDPETEELDHFDFKDGLQSNSFKIGSAFKNREGILYFGGIDGLNYFNPRLINANPYRPELIFDELEVLNSSVGIGEKLNDRVVLNKALSHKNQLEFRHNENEFSIELLGIHYSNPQKNEYAYQLEGYTA